MPMKFNSGLGNKRMFSINRNAKRESGCLDSHKDIGRFVNAAAIDCRGQFVESMEPVFFIFLIPRVVMTKFLTVFQSES